MTSTRCPKSASAAPKFTVVVVLPTPPFWLARANTRAVPDGVGAGAARGATRLARSRASFTLPSAPRRGETVARAPRPRTAPVGPAPVGTAPVGTAWSTGPVADNDTESGGFTWNALLRRTAPFTPQPRTTAGVYCCQNSGRLPGTPTRRGSRSGYVPSASSTTNDAPRDILRPARRSPTVARPAAGHRSLRVGASVSGPRSSLPSDDGGSDTTSTPPGRRNAAPHSAVTAGAPNPRAVTTPYRPRHC